MKLTQEEKASLEAAMANPKLAKKMLELVEAEAKEADAVEAAESEATLPEAVAKINEVIAALKAAGLMKSE